MKVLNGLNHTYLIRNQCTSFKGKVSEKLPIETGMPQGSILGSLAFYCFYQ